MQIEIEKRKNTAIEAAKKAGKVLAGSFKKPVSVKSKGNRQLVTDIDLKAEDAIVRSIQAEFPNDNILSEESRYPKHDTDVRWIIDPLDGTHNYIRGIDIFGTSIGVEYKGEVVIGVIYMPLTDELYVAQKQKGAYCNDKKINASKRPLKESTLIYDSSIRYNKALMLEGLDRLVDSVFNIRMFGSSARHLTDIAEGKAEIDVEFNDKVWDFAAGLLLVVEAGGMATDFQGKTWSTKTGGYIASNGIIHKDILKLLSPQ